MAVSVLLLIAAMLALGMSVFGATQGNVALTLTGQILGAMVACLSIFHLIVMASCG